MEGNRMNFTEQESAIIEKVRKVLARADESRNDNAHEREIAMRQAHAMLAKAGLEMADVGDIDEQKDYLGALVRGTFAMQTRSVWEAGIYNEIAKLNGCKVVREPSRHGSGQKVYVFGRKVRAEVIRQISTYVVQSILREARKTGMATVSFGNGAWSGVADQVWEILANMERGELDGERLSSGAALMVLNQHKQSLVEANKACRDAFPRLSSGRQNRSRDYGAYHAGREYGKSISLNNQIGQRSNGLLN